MKKSKGGSSSPGSGSSDGSDLDVKDAGAKGVKDIQKINKKEIPFGSDKFALVLCCYAFPQGER